MRLLLISGLIMAAFVGGIVWLFVSPPNEDCVRIPPEQMNHGPAAISYRCPSGSTVSQAGLFVGDDHPPIGLSRRQWESAPSACLLPDNIRAEMSTLLCKIGRASPGPECVPTAMTNLMEEKAVAFAVMKLCQEDRLASLYLATSSVDSFYLQRMAACALPSLDLRALDSAIATKVAVATNGKSCDAQVRASMEAKRAGLQREVSAVPSLFWEKTLKGLGTKINADGWLVAEH